MKIPILLVLAFALQAQETAAPDAKDQRIAFLERKLQIYQQAAFSCQDARIDEQARGPKPKQ